jgi:receptor protein-tyrosine kinase
MGSLYVLRALRTHAWLPLLSLLLAGCAGFLVSSQLLTPSFTAHTQLFVSTSFVASPSEVVESSEFARQRAVSYSRMLTGEEFSQRLIGAVALDTTPEELAARMTAEAVPDTVLIDVSIEDSDPQRAHRIAKAVGRVFPAMVTELETAGGGDSPVLVTVSDPAGLPRAPTSPNVAVHTCAAAFAGLLIGTVLVLSRVRLDRSIRDAATARTLAGAPVIGVVRSSRALSRQPFHPVGPESRRRTARRDRAAEDFRRIRSSFRSLDREDAPRTVLVTGAERGQGTSTVVVNLARAFAETGLRVLVVDADLRTAGVARHLAMAEGAGLSDVLLEAVEISSVAEPHDAGFSVLGAGQRQHPPGQVLASSVLPDVLIKLREENDVVLIDSPPLVPFADAGMLAPLVDGVLLTVRYGRTSADQLSEAVTVLGQVRARILGVVVTDAPADLLRTTTAP